MSRKKLTKKQMREDQFRDILEEFYFGVIEVLRSIGPLTWPAFWYSSSPASARCISGIRTNAMSPSPLTF
jgi:hypothetical protein